MTTSTNLAGEALEWFTTETRPSGERYRLLRPDAPEWLRDLIHEAHNGMLPDDWKYDFVYQALDTIFEGYDPNEIEPDHRHRDLLEWLGSHSERAGYCDEALDEFAPQSTFDIIALGQRLEMQEVHSIVQSVLQRMEAE